MNGRLLLALASAMPAGPTLPSGEEVSYKRGSEYEHGRVDNKPPPPG